MSKSIVVVDYDIGNLRSVARACEAAGGNVTLTNDPNCISRADRLLLPGVGAFPKCVAELCRLGLDAEIRNFFETGRPFLGICVGAQMMLENSAEFGRHDGLGFVRGSVEAIPPPGKGKKYKIPHVGWNALRRPQGVEWKGTALHDAQDDETFYFTHSFAMQPKDIAWVLASCEYHGNNFTAVVHKGYQYGCQFHPEKSGRAGLLFLERFLSL